MSRRVATPANGSGTPNSAAAISWQAVQSMTTPTSRRPNRAIEPGAVARHTEPLPGYADGRA